MAVLLLLFASATAFAQERITNFQSDIAIARDGTLIVSETIMVVAENRAIQHGIFRDFPTTYVDRFGRRVRVRFDVEEVTLDGKAEPYDIEPIANGRRVRIGRPDVFVTPGEHSYRITYKTDHQIGFFQDFDELYWNVTGNGWAFAIDRAEAVIHLPIGARPIQYAAYTGAQGAQDENARAFAAGDTMRFVTTAALRPREGLTVAVGFTKGIVAPPTAVQSTADALRDNAPMAAALSGLIALSAFYYLAWSRFGRDPARGVIIPLFSPPQGFSAAAVRFVQRMGYDRKAFAAALIAMAVKGYLKIGEEHGSYTLARTGKTEDSAGLALAERALAGALFAGRDQIALTNANHTAISGAISALKTALKREDEGVYFVSNRGWFYAGFLILVASGGAAAALADDPAASTFMLVWLSGWTAGTAALVWRAWMSWRDVARGPGSRIVNLFAALGATLFALPFLAGLAFGLYALNQSLPAAVLLALLAQGLLAAVFYRLLKAPTLAGGKVRDAIEGFRKFLVTAEKDRLEVLHPPKVTPEVFEKFLPYAIALDAENAWSRTFEAEAAAAGEQAGSTAYVPSWYSGPSFRRLGTAGFASAIGASVAGATAAAATAPGRVSGSGGGGSSGGGGGGGGGGGW